ncbi:MULTISPECIES: hypothetical protein [Pseudomonas]|jgi:hypothetical protein|uniref:Plasmid recombination enzyme n=1 Tax=Pseudomonas fragi TaxID=296 RepID=A0A9Q5B9Y8_PSEFR|nr:MULTISPECIES: hypothetical protein [Pseudomonas]KMM85658.1 hypothetical protein TU74_20020 [Pseudomonas lundensis]MCO7503076.1 hypothetical protein [Pseudomonas sp. VE 267-6A]MCO7532681.1 hypothetical protein [Pseudomonas sp. 2]MCU0213638.1 hypothetical protein [Pseudomonas shahriarae]NNB27999.1 hypothetical protein [Pseudomonas fragi]
MTEAKAKSKDQPTTEDKMNDTNLQTITLTKRDRNYSNLKGLDSSLRHSLRLDQNEYDDFEFNPNPDHPNVAIVGGIEQILTRELAEQLLADFNDQLQTKLKATEATDEIAAEKEKLRKLKSKLVKFINATEPTEIKEYVTSVIEGERPLVVGDYAALLNQHKISRISQRIDLLENYTTKKREIEQNAPDRAVSRTVNRVKEIILVIPEPNKLAITKAYTDLLQKAMHQFYQKNFPNNKMLFSFSHLDETTNHVHAFLDLQNEKTGKYDFSAQEFEFASQYYARNKAHLEKISEPPTLEDFKLPNRSEEKQNHRFIRERESWKSKVMQAAFYEHFNGLAAAYGLQAKFLPKTKENTEYLSPIEKEAKKPKSERSHNYYTRQLEKLQQELTSKEVKLIEQRATVVTLNTTIKDLQGTASNYKATIQSLEIQASEQRKENAELDSQKQKLDDEITVKTTKTAELSSNFKTMKSRMTKELKELRKKIKEDTSRKTILEKAIKAYEEELEPLMKRFDILVDRLLEARRLDENPEQYYKRLRENTYEMASRLGKEKRKDYLFNVAEQLKEQGLDDTQAALGFTDKVKLWASDTFTSKQIVEFEKEEAEQAKQARKRRLLKPKPPSPFQDPYQ